jgi:hypothetical protein
VRTMLRDRFSLGGASHGGPCLPCM